ncbi:hypothetical protein [Rhodococcus sp. 14-2483-1-2]|uniref:hypothetical protein n=1 Tax=Rhodococcus sp. 14-2483-1-2 TaxID=2023147 RepID=UPI001140069B|nr:hypothetical protein [Rhodococcus sp. 14-2483-1-2]
MTDEAAVNFSNSIAYPSTVIERITESVEPMTRSVRVESTYSYRFSSSGTTAVVPTDLVKRGVLRDGLKFFDHEDRRLSSLPNTRAAGYILSVIRRLLKQAGGTALVQFQTLDASGHSTELSLAALLVSTKPVEDSKVIDLTDAVALLPTTVNGGRLLLSINKMIRVIAGEYPLLVVAGKPPEQLDGTGTFRIRLIYRLIPDRYFVKVTGSGTNKRLWAEWLQGIPRRYLGIPPTSIAHELKNASRTASFHANIKGPERTYLGRQRVVNWPSNVDVDLSSNQYAMRRRLGQRHAHLYFSGTNDLRDSYYECTFFERVPGSVGQAALASLASTILLVIATIDHLGYTQLNKTDILAVLLALPAIAGTWLGLSQNDTISGPTVAARVSSIVTLATSLLGAWFYSVLPSFVSSAENGGVHGPASVASDPTHLTDRPWQWAWILVCGLAAGNLIGILTCWFFRSMVQAQFTGRTELT